MAVDRQYTFSAYANRKVNLNNMLTLTLSAGWDGLRKLVVVVLVLGCWLCQSTTM